MWYATFAGSRKADCARGIAVLAAALLGAAGGAAAAGGAPPSGILASGSITLRVEPGDSTLWLSTDALALHIDRRGNLDPVSILAPPGPASPESLALAVSLATAATSPGAFTFTAGASELSDFDVPRISAAIRFEPVTSPAFGSGARLTMTSSSRTAAVTRILEIELYHDHPDAAVMRARYVNTGGAPLAATRVTGARLALDLQRSSPLSPPWAFLAVQPTIDGWGANWIGVALAPGYARSNPLAGGTVLGRGGMPFTDLWSAAGGIALASLEPVPTALELPCRVRADGRVEIAMVVEPPASFGQFAPTLAPGDTLTSPRAALIAHRGDFHDAAARYGVLLNSALRASGRDDMGPYPGSAYRPYWKTWGLGSDFTRAEVYARLDGLADLGIARIGLDDGWFDSYGGWNPHPAKFPAGESDLVAFLRDIERPEWGASGDHGFETMLWWNPTGWQASSGLPASFVILDAAGTRPVDSRGHPYLCPGYAPAAGAILAMVDRFMGTWGVDALYMDGDGLLNVPPCHNPAHAHPRPASSFEALPDLYRAIRDRARAWQPGGTLILCECSAPHDPYKMPYYDQEDASDPVTDRMVRWKLKFMKALRGGRAPVGDGYVDPMPYNDLSGTFANALMAGGVLTTMYDTQAALGAATWETWAALHGTSGAAGAAYRNAGVMGFETPEPHAVERDDGSMIFGWWSDGAWEGPVTLRGLGAGMAYDLRELDTGVARGRVTGPEAAVTVPFHRQAPDKPWWLLLEARPAGLTAVPGTPDATGNDGGSLSPGDPVPAGGLLAAMPNPARNATRFVFRAGARSAGGPAANPGRVAGRLTGRAASLDIIDIRGRRVRAWRDIALVPSGAGELRAEVAWDGADARGLAAPPGLYIARLRWEGGEAVRRIMLVR